MIGSVDVRMSGSSSEDSPGAPNARPASCGILYLARRGAATRRRKYMIEERQEEVKQEEPKVDKSRVFRVDVWYASGRGAFRKAYWTEERAEEAAACFREEGYDATVTMMRLK